MQSINLRETTFHDVQPIFRRWWRWGKYEGPCTPARCTFDIWLSRGDSSLDTYLYQHLRAFGIATRLGASPVAIHVRLLVLDGRVWGELIAFGSEVRGWYPDGKPYLERVGGVAMSVSRISSWPLSMHGLHWRLHPNHLVWWPDNMPNDVRLEFTPFVNPADVHRLMFLNFACLTRRVPCADKKDIMPEAVASVAYWESLPVNQADLEPPCMDPDALVLELDGRDARNVVVAKVGAEKLRDGPGGYPETKLTIQQVLKRGKSSSLRIPSSFRMFQGSGPGPIAPVGASVIVFLKDDNFNPYSLEGCSPLTDTPAHLSIVRRGIAQDDRPAGLPDVASEPAGPP
jgi:hypothetical protein